MEDFDLEKENLALSSGIQMVKSGSTFVRQASFCMFIGYVFLVLCTIIFFREETFIKRHHFSPLWSYRELSNNIFAQLIMKMIIRNRTTKTLKASPLNNRSVCARPLVALTLQRRTCGMMWYSHRP